MSVVVGGGISGLAAAWELTRRDAGRARRRTDVVVLESRRGWAARCDSETFGGPRRRHGSRRLSRSPARGARPLPRDRPRAMPWSRSAGRGAGVWARGRLRPLPDGLALGIPTRFWPAARSGILGLRGQLGLARDALLPRPDVRGPHRRPLHRPAGGPQAGPAGGRPAGGPADRRHPRRVGGRHVGRRHLPACSWPRPRGGAASCARAARPRSRPRRPTRRRCSGPSTAAWRP